MLQKHELLPNCRNSNKNINATIIDKDKCDSSDNNNQNGETKFTQEQYQALLRLINQHNHYNSDIAYTRFIYTCIPELKNPNMTFLDNDIT